ncbi:DUF3892 domain-containing protein [Candidatus Poriferisodalis sp.]|uniref:DUF3892 domain-containing protein n=1 Tax=Candidatus Poriferisodalis sp. TaxID=3101277 RepID=UPI003B0199CC
MDRAVTQTGKDIYGDITRLCNPTATWSSVSKETAIYHIENYIHTYHVPWRTGRTEIRVVNGPNGKYLRTDQDHTTRNNLNDLPDC